LDRYVVSMGDPLSYPRAEFGNAFLATVAAKPNQEELEE